jgi:hypothetical protein
VRAGYGVLVSDAFNRDSVATQADAWRVMVPMLSAYVVTLGTTVGVIQAAKQRGHDERALLAERRADGAVAAVLPEVGVTGPSVHIGHQKSPVGQSFDLSGDRDNQWHAFDYARQLAGNTGIGDANYDSLASTWTMTQTYGGYAGDGQ